MLRTCKIYAFAYPPGGSDQTLDFFAYQQQNPPDWRQIPSACSDELQRCCQSEYPITILTNDLVCKEAMFVGHILVDDEESQRPLAVSEFVSSL